MERKKRSVKKQRQIQAWIRFVIQLLFFLLLPSTFTTAFAGVKYIFTQMGNGAGVACTSFVTILIVTGIYTIVFGRFFCGYACAFGSFGDAVHGLYTLLCKKTKKKKIVWNSKITRKLLLFKYIVLLVIVLLCFNGVYQKCQGTSPWDVFSMMRAGNFRLGAYGIGLVLLLCIIVGMFFCERFFCRFLCPMGAVFALLPSIPLFAVRRDRQQCVKGCQACERICVAGIELPEVEKGEVSGECFQCGKCIGVCPKKNAGIAKLPWKGNEFWFTILRAVILFLVLYFAGV